MKTSSSVRPNEAARMLSVIKASHQETIRKPAPLLSRRLCLLVTCAIAILVAIANQAFGIETHQSTLEALGIKSEAPSLEWPDPIKVLANLQGAQASESPAKAPSEAISAEPQPSSSRKTVVSAATTITKTASMNHGNQPGASGLLGGRRRRQANVDADADPVAAGDDKEPEFEAAAKAEVGVQAGGEPNGWSSSPQAALPSRSAPIRRSLGDIDGLSVEEPPVGSRRAVEARASRNVSSSSVINLSNTQKQHGDNGCCTGSECATNLADQASGCGCGSQSVESARLAGLLARHYRTDTPAGSDSQEKQQQQRQQKPSAANSSEGAGASRLPELPRPSNVRVLIISYYPPILKLSWSLDKLSEEESSQLDFYKGAGLNSRGGNGLLDMELAFKGEHLQKAEAGRAEASAPAGNASATVTPLAASFEQQGENDDGSLLLAELERRRLLLRKSLSCFQVTYNIINSRFKVVEEYPPYLRSIMLERLAPATEYSLYVVAVYLGKYRLFSERVSFVSPTDNESRRFKENTYRPIHRYPDERRELQVGLAQARGEELTIVTIAVAFWAATIYMFFNKWGKIRMLEPYQPAYRDTSGGSGAGVATGGPFGPAHQLLPGTGPGSAGTGSGALAGIGAKMSSFCGGLGAAGAAMAQQATSTLEPSSQAAAAASGPYKHSIGSAGTLSGSLARIGGGGATPVGAPTPSTSGQHQQFFHHHHQHQQQQLISAAVAAATAAGGMQAAGASSGSSRLSDPSAGGRKSSRSLLLLGSNGKRYETLADEYPLRRTHAELNDLFQSKAQMLAKAATSWSRQQQFRSRLAASAGGASSSQQQHSSMVGQHLQQHRGRLRHSAQLGSDFELLAGVQGRSVAAARWLRQRGPLQAMQAIQAAHTSGQHLAPVEQGFAASALLSGTARAQHHQQQLFCRPQSSSVEADGARSSPSTSQAGGSRKDLAAAAGAARKRSFGRLEQLGWTGASLSGGRAQLLRYHRQSRAIDYTSSTCFARSGARSLDQQTSSSLVGGREQSVARAREQQLLLAPAIDCSQADLVAPDDNGNGGGCDGDDNMAAAAQLKANDNDEPEREAMAVDEGGSSGGLAGAAANNKLRRLLFISKTHQHHHIATSTSSSALIQQNQEALSVSTPAAPVGDPASSAAPPSRPWSLAASSLDGGHQTEVVLELLDNSSNLRLANVAGDLSVVSSMSPRRADVSVSSTSLPSNIVSDTPPAAAAGEDDNSSMEIINDQHQHQGRSTTSKPPTSSGGLQLSAAVSASRAGGRNGSSRSSSSNGSPSDRARKSGARDSSGLIEHHILIEPPSPPPLGNGQRRSDDLSLSREGGEWPVCGGDGDQELIAGEPGEGGRHSSATTYDSRSFSIGPVGKPRVFMRQPQQGQQQKAHLRQLGESYQLDLSAAAAALKRRRDSSPARHFGSGRPAAEQVLHLQQSGGPTGSAFQPGGRPFTAEPDDHKSLAISRLRLAGRRRSQQQQRFGRDCSLLETPPGRGVSGLGAQRQLRGHQSLGELCPIACCPTATSVSGWRNLSSSTGAASEASRLTRGAQALMQAAGRGSSFFASSFESSRQRQLQQLLVGGPANQTAPTTSTARGGSYHGQTVAGGGSDEQQPEICLELPASHDEAEATEDAFTKLAQYQSQARLLRGRRQSCQLCSCCLTCFAAEHQHQYAAASSHASGQPAVCLCDLQSAAAGSQPSCSLEGQVTMGGDVGAGRPARPHTLPPPLCRRSAATESSGEESDAIQQQQLEEEDTNSQRPRMSSVFDASPHSRAHRDSFAMLRALSQKKSKSAEDVAYLSNLVLQIWARDPNPLLQSASQQQLSHSRHQPQQHQQQRARQKPKSSLTVAHI